MPTPYEVRHSSADDRLLKPSPLPAGHLGSTSDEYELFVGSPDTAIGRAVTHPQAPKSGLDVRRLFNAACQGQEDTWTDVSSVVRDASGMVLSPKPGGSPGTDVITTGYILPGELADGGKITIEAIGNFKCGSILPRILAKLKVGGYYVAPQYEALMNSAGATAAPTDISGPTTEAFEWSSNTIGLNALAGYEALLVDAVNLDPGTFQWRLTINVHSLGRYAKWEQLNDDVTDWLTATGYTTANRTRSTTRAGRTFLCTVNHTSGASTEPGVGASWATVWREITGKLFVEATLEWGAMMYNAGGRIGEPFAYYNTTAARNLQYHAYMPTGTIRGAVYSFMGQQWLCHAASTTSALDASVNPDELLPDIWTSMLADEAPGIGAHWREFFVPLVSKATFTATHYVDLMAGNEIQLEMGGPQQEDLGLPWITYSATDSYLAELGLSPFTAENRAVEAAGVQYAPKVTILSGATYPHFAYDAGTGTSLSDYTTVGPASTFTAAPPDTRFWRALPATLRDEMRLQHVHGYLFGRKNGVAERRV